MSFINAFESNLAYFECSHEETPELLFKYKALGTPEDANRAVDILNNKRIYLPTPSELNDPFEGCSVVLNGCWAGCSMSPSLGYLQSPMKDALDRFRVLSLTRKWDSPQMWAHYACGYRGICIAIKTSTFQTNCFAIKYGFEPKRLSIPGPEALEAEGYLGSTDAYAGLSLLRKQADWEYEAEWRALFHESEGQGAFLQLEDDAIPFVLLGQNIEKTNAQQICEVCENENIPVFITHQMPYQLRIMALPVGLELCFDGRTASEQSAMYCREHSITPFEKLCEAESKNN